jgi:hypothetical protein
MVSRCVSVALGCAIYRRFDLCGLARELDVDGCSLAPFTFDPDFAAVHLDDAFDDNETKSSAKSRARFFIVRTEERSEEFLLVFRLDANALVCD